MTIDMQARRDAFIMLTDEDPPERLKRWLVVWEMNDGIDEWTEWARFDEPIAAEMLAIEMNGQVHDLDAQS